MFILYRNAAAIYDKAAEILESLGAYFGDRTDWATISKLFYGENPEHIIQYLPLLIDFYTTVTDSSGERHIDMVYCSRNTAKSLVYPRTNRCSKSWRWSIVKTQKEANNYVADIKRLSHSEQVAFHYPDIVTGDISGPVLIDYRISHDLSVNKLIRVANIFCVDLVLAKKLVYYKKANATQRLKFIKAGGVMSEQLKSFIRTRVHSLLEDGNDAPSIKDHIRKLFHTEECVHYATKIIDAAGDPGVSDELFANGLKPKVKSFYQIAMKRYEKVYEKKMKKVKQMEGEEDDIPY